MCQHVLSFVTRCSPPDTGVKKTATSGKPVAASSPLLSLFWHHCGPSRLLFVQRFVFPSIHLPLYSVRLYLSSLPSHEEKSCCMQLTVTLLHISFKTRFVPSLVPSVQLEVSQREPLLPMNCLFTWTIPLCYDPSRKNISTGISWFTEFLYVGVHTKFFFFSISSQVLFCSLPFQYA